MLLVAFIAAVIVVQGTAIQSVWAGEGSEAELKQCCCYYREKAVANDEKTSFANKSRTDHTFAK